MGRSFYVCKNKNGKFTAEILNPETGERVCFRTVNAKTYAEACEIASGWVHNGIPERKRGRAPVYKKPVSQSAEVISNLAGILKIVKAAELDAAGALQIAEALRDRGLLAIPASGARRDTDFIAYLKNFFDYDKSPYIREKLAHGQSIGRRYCMEAAKKIERFWEAHFQGRGLASITRQDLKGFSMHIAKRGFSSYYLNAILKAGTIPLAYAAQEGLIPANPAQGIKMFAHTGQKRGCMTPQEAAAVFSCYWPDRKSYIGNILAMTTGARMGEVLAIAKNDIDTEKPVLHIRHSWGTKYRDGLKSPKNGEARKVPLLPEVKKMLLELLEENPHKTDNPFVFYGQEPDKPRYDGIFLYKGLIDAMGKCGIDYKARKICFHSHRHFYAARLADTMAAEQVQRVTGHKTKAVFEAYADHVIDENIEAVGAAAGKVFGNILQFRKGA